MDCIRRCRNEDKNKKRSMDITQEYLIDLYNSNNKCYYCNIELDIIIGSKNPNQISCDRLDSSKGHLKDNIVLSCMFCNYAKNISNYTDYHNFINKLIFKEYQVDHDSSKYNNLYASNMLKSLKSQCEHDKINCEMTLQDVKDLFTQQNGKSALTGIEMYPSKIPYYPFQPSLDRIDNNKPHTKDNLHMVCLSENMGRNSMTIEEFQDYIQQLKNINNSNQIINIKNDEQDIVDVEFKDNIKII